MYDYCVTSLGNIEFKVDLNIYSDAVISKVLYWLAADYSIESKNLSLSTRIIDLYPKPKTLNVEDIESSRHRISQLFADFRVRELVRKETEAIRNILYLKAFANYPELEDLRGEE